MNDILNKFANNPAFKAFRNYQDNLGNLSVIEEALMIVDAFTKNKESLLIVKNNAYNAQLLYECLKNILKEHCYLYLREENLRIDSICASPEGAANRLEVLNEIIADNHCVCICDIATLTSYMIDPDKFKSQHIHLQVNQEYDYELLKKQLTMNGYHKQVYVDLPMTYASRGGIIDIFSLNYDRPIRIEFFDNEIESIRFFDLETKKTIEKVDQVEIINAQELSFSDDEVKQIVNTLETKFNDKFILNNIVEEIESHEIKPLFQIFLKYLDNKYSLVDYIKNPKVIFSSLEEIESHYRLVKEENIAYLQELVEVDEFLPIYDYDQDINKFLTKAMIIHEMSDQKNPVYSNIDLLPTFDGNLEKRLSMIEHAYNDSYQLYFSVSKVEKKVLKDEYHLQADFIEDIFNQGFVANDEKLVVVTSKELFDTNKVNKRINNKFNQAENIDNYLNLNVGDFIVHKHYGVGKYLGIETKVKNNIHKDYLKIAYRGDDVLYIPIEQFKLIRKFVSKEGVVPKLNKLGTNEWKKTKAKVDANVQQIAEKLVKIYASRESCEGYQFSKDTPYQKEFEDAFPYELTQDQKRAIDEIKKDMESPKPMDRLLCGDVGFGKTEVAFNAAFKAILDNKQVAFMCPTTILSFQHYQTAMKRFKDFPINIRVLNRFISTKETNQVLEELKEGKVDLLIGTHKILSSKVVFKDLGLLIIDEEQRFGVVQKEKIKELKNSVDVLSMSATPIPRTLQMSLVGLRSLSQLNTPPKNRQSVQTYVVQKDENLIKEVIQRELARKGQVFYLHNNVNTINSIAIKLQKLIPNIRVAIAHGKMQKSEIEDIMVKFEKHEFDVLISTTIVETGIDIPNANTILIDNADHFGLSQLYQIKGRVGRSERLGFAYLMYDGHKELSDIARKRLKSMKEFTKLGSGYKIALMDLSIRGAGEMLGAKQAGFIDTVGIDMYIEMLNDAIKKAKGIDVLDKDIDIGRKSNLDVDAYIPAKFEDYDYEKIALYQKVEACNDVKTLNDLYQLTSDTYGKLPKEINLIFEKRELDILINNPNIADFKQTNKQMTIIFTKKWSDNVDGIKLFEIANEISKDLKISYKDSQIHVSIVKDNKCLEIMLQFISKVLG